MPDGARWIRWLFRGAAWRASEAELGDVMEEYAGGNRSALWLVRQILSTLRGRRSHVAIPDGRVEMLSNMWSDIRHTVRTLYRQPGFAVAAIAPIALGIGINTGLFSILNSIALRPLPVPASTELVSIFQEFQGVDQRSVHGARTMFSMPEYRAFRDRTETLSGLMAYSWVWTATLGGPSPQEIRGVLVTCNYFDVLQLRPVMGTGFTEANCDRSGAPPAVILSHALWTYTFDADPDIIHRTITLNGHEVAVVGVGPEGFDGLDLTKAGFFAPTAQQSVLHPKEDFHEDPHTSWLMPAGRLNPGVGIAQARAELDVIASGIDRDQPGRTTTLIVAPATSLSLPPTRRIVLTLATVVLAACGLVLLIACANVANVLLARAVGRAKEIAVRLSVGASRGRLIQQFLTESLVVALAGGVVGSLLAWWSFQALLAWVLSSLPGAIPPLRIDAQPNLTVLWFALGLTVTTALVCGMTPALQASKPDVQAALKQDGTTSGGRTGGWLRGALIGVQVAVCLMLLIATGLLVRALYAAETVEPGFDYRNVAVVSVDLRGPGYDDQQRAAFQQRMIERISALPGVEAVAQASKIPLSPGRHQATFRLSGQHGSHLVELNIVSAEYFSVVGIPIVRGRTFASAEIESPRSAVIVTEATARRYWPDQDPIGRTVLMDEDAPREIVGVAKDAQVSQLGEAASSFLYLPAGSEAPGEPHLLVRSRSDVAAIAPAIRRQVRALDPDLLVHVSPLEETLRFWQTVSRLIASLSAMLGVLALVLASVGVYGVVSYAVSRRRREVGIRMTLGASGRDVRRLILRQTLRPLVVGVLVGLAAASMVSHVLEHVLFGISPLDPIAFLGASLFLLAVAAVASLVPTRAATKVDPMTILRYE